MDPTRISYGTLTLLRADNSSRAAFPLTKPTATFGRLAECDVRIVLPSVSKLHAELSVAEDFSAEIIVHSINGLIVNGVSCEKGSRMRLQSGDNITICERVFKFTTGGIEVIAIDSPIPNRRTSTRHSLVPQTKLTTPAKTLAPSQPSPAPLFSFDSPMQPSQQSEISLNEQEGSDLIGLMAWDDEPVEAVDGPNGDLITLEEEEELEEEIAESVEKVLTPVKELVKKFELVATPSLAHRARASGVPASAQRAPPTQGGSKERRRRSMRMTIIPSETAINFVAEREALRQQSQSPISIKPSTPAKSPTKIASLSLQGTPSRPSSQVASAPATPRPVSHSSSTSTPRMASANSSTSRRISALLLSGNSRGSLIDAFEDADKAGPSAMDDDTSDSSEDEDEDAAFGFEPISKVEDLAVEVEEINSVAFEDAPVSPSPLQIVTNTPTLVRHSSARRHSLREKVLIRSAIKQSISPVDSPVSMIYGGSAADKDATSAVDAEEEEQEVEEEIIVAMQESPSRSVHQHRDSIELTRSRSPAKSPSRSIPVLPTTPTPVSSVVSSPKSAPRIASPGRSGTPVVEIIMPRKSDSVERFVEAGPSTGSPSPVARVIAGRPRLSLAARKLLAKAATIPLPETPAPAIVSAPTPVQQAPAWTPSNHRRARDTISATPIIFRVGATPVVAAVPTPAKVVGVAPATPVRAEMVPLPETPAGEAYSYTPRAVVVVAPSTPEQFEDRAAPTEQEDDESFASSSDGAESIIEGEREAFQSEMTSPVNQHRVMATPRSALRPTSSHGPPLSHSTTYSNSLSSNSFLNSHRKLPTSASTASFFANLVAPVLQLSIPLSPSISSIANLSGMGNTPGTLKRKVAFNEEVFIQEIMDIRDKRMHWDEERDFEVVAATPVKNDGGEKRKESGRLAARSPAARLNNTPRPISSRAATPSRSTPAANTTPFVPITHSLAPTETPTRRAQRVPTLTPAENVRRVLLEDQPRPSPQRVPTRSVVGMGLTTPARVEVESGVEGFASVLRRASRTALPVTPALESLEKDEEEGPTAQVSPTKSARRIPATPSKATALPSTTPTKSLTESTNSTRTPAPRSASKTTLKKSTSKSNLKSRVTPGSSAAGEVGEEGGEIMRASRMTLALSTPVVKKVSTTSKAPSSEIVRGRKVEIQKLLDTPVSKGLDAAKAIKSVPRTMTVAGMREEVEIRRRLSMPASAVDSTFTFARPAAVPQADSEIEVEAEVEVEVGAEVEEEVVEEPKLDTPIRKVIPNHAMNAPAPSFLGIKSLFTQSPTVKPTPTAPQTPNFVGITKLFAQQPAPSSLLDPTTSRSASTMATPKYTGVREMMTSDQKVVGKTPRFAGLREMFAARKVVAKDGEYLVGAEELFEVASPVEPVVPEVVAPAVVEEVFEEVVEEVMEEEKHVEQERKELVESVLLEVGGSVDRQECASPVRSAITSALPSTPLIITPEPTVVAEEEFVLAPVEAIVEIPAIEEVVEAVEDKAEEEEEVPVVAPVRRGRPAKAAVAKRAPVVRKSRAVVVVAPEIEEVAPVAPVEEEVVEEEVVVKKPATKTRATRVARSTPAVAAVAEAEVEEEVVPVKRGRAATKKSVVVEKVAEEAVEEAVEEEKIEVKAVAKPTRGRKAAVKKVVVEESPVEAVVPVVEEEVIAPVAKKPTTTRAKRTTKAAVIIHEDDSEIASPPVVEKPTRAARSTRAPLSVASQTQSADSEPAPSTSTKPSTIAKGRKKAVVVVVEPSVEDAEEEEIAKENVVVKKVAAKRAPAVKKVVKVVKAVVEEEQAAPVGRSMRTRR